MVDHRVRGLAAVLLTVVLAGCWLEDGGEPGNTRSDTIERELRAGTLASATEQWRAPLDGVVTEPVVSEDRIYVATRPSDDPDVALTTLAARAYDRNTGRLVWERSFLPGDGTSVRGGIATPALRDGVLWVPYWHDGLGPCAGRLARLDARTGAVLTSGPIGTEPSAAVIAGSLVATTERDCEQGALLVVRDAATRAALWSHELPTGVGIAPTIADGRLFVRADGTLYAFAAQGCGAPTCAPLWRRSDVDPGLFDTVRVGTGDGGTAVITIGTPSGGDAATLVVHDAATGEIRWQAESRYTGRLPGAIAGAAAAGGTVYVAGTRHDPSELDPTAILDAYPLEGCGRATCAPAWTAELGSTRPSGTPTVADGVVYVPLVGGGTVTPAISAVDTDGCAASTCDEVGRLPLVAPGLPVIGDARPYATSVGAGSVLVAWSPGWYGTTDTELVSFGPPAADPSGRSPPGAGGPWGATTTGWPERR